MNYSKIFKEAVEHSLNKTDYLGYGNPNSKILLIGKELAGPSNYKNEENGKFWKINIDNPDLKIQNWRENGIDREEFFNPLFPYKGMKLNDQKEAATWRKYQKLLDYVENNFDKNKDRLYTFYNDSFLTELNDNPSNFSHLQIEERRRKSINNRVENFFNLPFIQNFPIVIMANSHYIRDYNVDVCKLFDVEYEEGKTRIVNGNSNQWFNVHINKKTPKLLIHTRQLSYNITDDLLKEIAFEIQKFKIDYNII